MITHLVSSRIYLKPWSACQAADFIWKITNPEKASHTKNGNR